MQTTWKTMINLRWRATTRALIAAFLLTSCGEMPTAPASDELTLAPAQASESNSSSSSNRPRLRVSDEELEFNAKKGDRSPNPQIVKITSDVSTQITGIAVQKITYKKASGWLSATLSRSTTPLDLTLKVTPGSLKKGTYIADVYLSSTNGSNTPYVVHVLLKLRDGDDDDACGEDDDEDECAKSLVASVPSSTVTGAIVSPAPTATIKYASGSTNTSATGTVTVSTTTAGASLSGGTSATVVSGVATFSTLRVTRSTAGPVALLFTWSGGATTTQNINVTLPAPVATTLAATAPATATSGVALSPALTATVRDQNGA
ncbi:MAG: hypothetical protein K2X99_13450, partial [Gemmatimonadaceae bacterium]|nr:hypothetical protein [Gemmatimonadaceae bacterium]